MTTRIDGVMQSESIYDAVRCLQNAKGSESCFLSLPAESLLASVPANNRGSLRTLLMYVSRRRNVLTKTGQVRRLTILSFPVNAAASLLRNISARGVCRTGRKIKKCKIL